MSLSMQVSAARHGSTSGNIRATRKLLIYHPGYTSLIVYFFTFSLYPGNNYTLLIVIERLQLPRDFRVIRSVLSLCARCAIISMQKSLSSYAKLELIRVIHCASRQSVLRAMISQLFRIFPRGYIFSRRRLSVCSSR